MTFSKKYALGLGCFFIALVAVTLHVWQLFFMAAALGLMAPTSWLLTRRKLSGLRATRLVPATIYAGQPARAALEIANSSGFSRRSLFEACDTLPPGVSGGDDLVQLIADLGAGETTRMEYEFTPQLRGVYRLGPVRFSVGDALGIYSFSTVEDCFSEVVAYPVALALPALWPRAFAEVGEARRRRVAGPGLDYRAVREYAPGDDLRRISWTNTARRGALMVVESEQQETAACAIALDLTAGVHAGSGARSSLEYGVTLAATLVHQAVERGVAPALIAVGRQDHSVEATARGDAEVWLLEALARCADDGQTDFGEVVRGAVARARRAGAIAVVSPQVGPAMVELARWLVARRLAVVWFCLRAADFAPPVSGGADSDAPYERFTASLRGIGCQCHLVSGHMPLSASFRGWSHAAS